MKTLYDILGLGATATPEQVEHAYAAIRTRLEANQEGIPSSELHNQRVAAKEAYATLSDPLARQRYDQRLAMTQETNARPLVVDGAETSGNSFGIKALLVVGLFVLAAIYLYNEKAKERERLRIEHEHELQMKAVQIEEDRQHHNAQMQDAMLETMADNAATQERLSQQRQFEADSIQHERIELQRQQIESRNRQMLAQQQQREEAMRQRQEQMQAQQRAQAEKRYLQQLEREHYGKVITY